MIRQLRSVIIASAAIALAAVVEYLKHPFYYKVKSHYYEYKVRRTAEETKPGLYVRDKAVVNSNTKLGKGTHFHGIKIHDHGPVTIGDNFHAGEGCDILTENHTYDTGDAIPYGETNRHEPVEIGDNVWFGMNVTVLPGVSIGEGAIIQAGSTVVDDIPKGAIAGGHPAETFDYRDMDHYNKLKAEEKFN
jgi:acetyltransferase-like isoleucine patch superfamily enzyme